MPEKKLYDWLYSRTWLRQKWKYWRAFSRPFGARCGPRLWQPGHSHWAASSRACASCFALSLFGLMRMRSKNFDESIGMTDFDYATRKASSLDIAKPLQLRKIAIDGRAPQTYLAAMTTRDTIINKLREAFIP